MLDRRRWAAASVSEFFFGYGQRLHYIILVVLLLVTVVFPAGYLIFGGVTKDQSAASEPHFGDLIAFSLASFTTVSFNHLQPSTTGAHISAAVEAGLGISSLAIAVDYLIRRIIRGRS